MAGIGFVLKKVLKEESIFSLIKVAFAGSIIVAGPWILSIVGIFFIGQFSEYAISESRGMFMGVVIYSYAFSLFIFGGIHYIFTRQVADYIYEELNAKAGASLLLFSIIILVLALLTSSFAIFTQDLSFMQHPLLFQLSAVLLFCSINLMWILMIFISLSKRYLLIFFIYLGGMVLSFIGVFVLGKIYASGGAMLGFSLGQFIIVLSLYVIAFVEYPPGKMSVKAFLQYAVKYKYLLLSGLFYYWGMWIDKIVFWIFDGEQIGGSFIRLFDAYDMPVYIANLTMIPGLIYFVIVSETDFFTKLKEFLNQLHTSVISKILDRKYKMINSMRKALLDQSLFQGIFTLVMIVLAEYLAIHLFDIRINPLVFRLVLGAVFFHLLFLTVSTFLYYLQLYHYSFIAALVFFLSNLILAIFISLFHLEQFYGLSYLVSTMLGTVVALAFLLPSIKHFDRQIFSGQVDE
ncbi:MAG: exopolysaccharide Pel transporter PelG [Spirochaetales bacterium]|nr:exopolysaccharide Pel transporter PelG [Spirochaetales bacterium]